MRKWKTSGLSVALASTFTRRRAHVYGDFRALVMNSASRQPRYVCVRLRISEEIARICVSSPALLKMAKYSPDLQTSRFPKYFETHRL